MKIEIIICFISTLIFSCSNSTIDSTVFLHDIYIDSNGDTINKFDSNNLRQGKWVVYRQGDDRSITNINSIDSVGVYKDNIKVGYWKKYSKYGDIVDSAFYENGVIKIDSNKTYTFTSN